MTTEDADRDALDWHAAHTGIDVIADGELVEDDGFLGSKVERLIERLLDQLDACGRPAYDGEDSHLRLAISAYEMGADKSAVHQAWRAARIGRVPIFNEMFPPDRSVSLREELKRARATRASGRAA